MEIQGPQARTLLPVVDNRPVANTPADQAAVAAKATQAALRASRDNQETLRSHTDVRVGWDRGTHTYTFTVVDRATGEKLRQLPPEAVLEIVTKMLARGEPQED